MPTTVKGPLEIKTEGNPFPPSAPAVPSLEEGEVTAKASGNPFPPSTDPAPPVEGEPDLDEAEAMEEIDESEAEGLEEVTVTEEDMPTPPKSNARKRR